MTDSVQIVPTHTDEVRQMLADGVIQPGNKALDLPIDSMTDREMLAECLIHSRNTRDAVVALMEGINSSPLGKMIAGGTVPGPLGSLFGPDSANGK